jgi:hypothetical protein
MAGIIIQIQASITSEAKDNLGEYEKNATEKQKDTNIQDKAQLPLKPSHGVEKYQVPNSRGQQPKLKISQWQKTILPLKPRQIKRSAKLNERRQPPLKKITQSFIN